MKKSSIFLLGILGLLAGACAEDVEPSTPQYNPQEPILNSAEDVISEKAGVLASTDPIALESYNEPEAKIPVMKLEKAENLPVGAEIVYKLELSATADFAKSQTLVAEPSEEDPTIYEVDAAEWELAQIALFGNTVKVQTCYYRVPVYISLAGSEYRLDSPTYYAADGVFRITRMYPGYVVEDDYYVFGSFLGGNSPATAVEMNHAAGVDAYDDPEFSFIFNVSEDEATAGYTIYIAPGSLHNANATANQCFGSSNPNGTEGDLIVGGAPMNVEVAGPYKLTVNMKDLTYTLAVAPEVVYAPCKTAMFNSPKCLPLHTSDYVSYQGLTYVENEFVISTTKNWKGIVYCYGGEEGKLKMFTGNNTAVLSDPDAVIKTKGKGSHWITVNVAKLTYEATFVKTLGLVGGFNNWGNEENGVVLPDIAMTPDANFSIWTGEFTVTEPTGWKIRVNEDWAINFGAGDGNETSLGGGDWQAEEAGTYEVIFNCSAYPYTVTVSKK